MLDLQIFTDQKEAADALAQAVAEDIRASLALADSGVARALLLVSGGRSPLPFFSALAHQNLPWERVDIAPVDERVVPAEHADFNAALIAKHLLQANARKSGLLHLVDASVDESDTWRWAQRSAQSANSNPALAKPTVIVLGVGTDGHTASLFADAPQWPEASSTAQRYVAVMPTRAPHARVSLSLTAIAAQGECYVWSTGAEKLAVIKQGQALVAATAEGLIDAIALHGAGPFVQLLAHPGVLLRVFHSE